MSEFSKQDLEFLCMFIQCDKCRKRQSLPGTANYEEGVDAAQRLGWIVIHKPHHYCSRECCFAAGKTPLRLLKIKPDESENHD